MKIGGIVENRDLTLYRLTAVRDEPGSAAEVLRFFAANKINLEYITESSTTQGLAVMAIGVSHATEAQVDQYLEQNEDVKRMLKVKKIPHVSVLGIYGPHFREKPALAVHFCHTLGRAGINIMGLSSSISSISALIRNEDIEKAKDALLGIFELP